MLKQRGLWLLLLLAFALRLPLLNGSFWLDEAAQALESARPFSEQLAIVEDFQPPLLHYLVHFSLQISQSEWWLRLWGALVPGLVTIYAAHQLGEKLFNKRVGLIAGLLLTTSSFHIFYSQELRPYSLPTMWAMLSTLLLFNKKVPWGWFIVVNALGCYSSYLYPFYFLAQLWLIAQNRINRPMMMKVALAVLLLFLPWLPSFFQQLSAGQLVRATLPGWETIVSTSQIKALVLVPLKFIFGVLNIEPTMWFIFIILFIAMLFSLIWKQSQSTSNQTIRQLFWLFSLPFLTSWLSSFFVPVIQPKRLLFLLPLFYLLMSAHLVAKFKRSNALLAWSLPTLLLMINCYGTWQYWVNPKLQREDWRGLITTITQRFPADKTVALMAFDEAFAPWRWYKPAGIDVLTTGQRTVTKDTELSTTLKSINDYHYVLVFDYLRDLTDPADMLPKTVEGFGFSGKGVIDYPNLGFVRIYSKSEYTLGNIP